MKIIDLEQVTKMLCYDETSPSCLRWIWAPNKSVKNGDVAGYIKTDGYWAVKIKGKLYPAHRIVLALHGVDVNGNYVDHINRNRADNRFQNLRIATVTENNQNKNLKVRQEVVRGFRYFSVLCKSTGRHKRFSVFKHGEQKAQEMASLFLKQEQQAQIEALTAHIAALEAG